MTWGLSDDPPELSFAPRTVYNKTVNPYLQLLIKTGSFSAGWGI